MMKKRLLRAAQEPGAWLPACLWVVSHPCKAAGLFPFLKVTWLRLEAVTEIVVTGCSRMPCCLPQDPCFSLWFPSSADGSLRATWAPGRGCDTGCHGTLSLASLTRRFPVSQRQLGVRAPGARSCSVGSRRLPTPPLCPARIQGGQPAPDRRSDPAGMESIRSLHRVRTQAQSEEKAHISRRHGVSRARCANSQIHVVSWQSGEFPS